MTEKIHLIYRTTNRLNGRFYVGMHSTTNLDDGYLGSGDRLQSEVRKHGKGNFVHEVLQTADSRESLKELEKQYVNKKLLADPLCLNLKEGGDGGATRSGIKGGKIGGKLTGRTNFQKAHQTMKERGTLFTLGMQGRQQTEETRRRMSEAQTGESNSQFGSRWMNKDGTVLKVSSDKVSIHLLQGFSLGRKTAQRG